MEDYIENPKEVLVVECKKTPEVQQCSPPPLPEPEETEKLEEPIVEPPDLLALYNPVPVASKFDEKNSLALTIFLIADQTVSPDASVQENGTTGWELALATATYKMKGRRLGQVYVGQLASDGVMLVSYYWL